MKVFFLTIQRVTSGFLGLFKLDGIQIGSIICFVMYFIIAGLVDNCRDENVTKREAAVWQAEKDKIWFQKEAVCAEHCGGTYMYRDGTCFCSGEARPVTIEPEVESSDTCEI